MRRAIAFCISATHPMARLDPPSDAADQLPFRGKRVASSRGSGVKESQWDVRDGRYDERIHPRHYGDSTKRGTEGTEDGRCPRQREGISGMSAERSVAADALGGNYPTAFHGEAVARLRALGRGCQRRPALGQHLCRSSTALSQKKFWNGERRCCETDRCMQAARGRRIQVAACAGAWDLAHAALQSDAAGIRDPRRAELPAFEHSVVGTACRVVQFTDGTPLRCGGRARVLRFCRVAADPRSRPPASAVARGATLILGLRARAYSVMCGVVRDPSF